MRKRCSPAALSWGIYKTQLFDLQTDPRETNDLADKREHAAKAEEMMALLAKAQEQWGDAWPLVSPSPASPEWTPPTKERPSAASKFRHSIRSHEFTGHLVVCILLFGALWRDCLFVGRACLTPFPFTLHGTSAKDLVDQSEQLRVARAK